MSGLVFDLGGTHLRAATVAADGSLDRIDKERLATLAERGTAAAVWQDIIARLETHVERRICDTPPGSPIVLAFPGPIDEHGRILQAPTLTGGDTRIPDLRAHLEQFSGRRVHVLNDLSAAAWYLSRTLRERFLVVTVSSGIGSKLFDPAIGVLDDVAYAGEIGHTVVEWAADAPVCDCGGRGHLGAIASGRGIERYARAEARRDPRAFAHSLAASRFGATLETLGNEPHLVPALRAGDPWAHACLLACTQYLARTLVQLIAGAGLRRVVVIGGFALSAGATYLEVLRQALADNCDYDLLRGRVAEMVVLGEVADEACLAGAGEYARRTMLP